MGNKKKGIWPAIGFFFLGVGVTLLFFSLLIIPYYQDQVKSIASYYQEKFQQSEMQPSSYFPNPIDFNSFNWNQISIGQLNLTNDTHNSMQPTFNNNSQILAVKISPYTNLFVGDIIVFNPPGKNNSVSHRIISESMNNGVLEYQTKGDHNDLPDSYQINRTQIIAKVVGVLY